VTTMTAHRHVVAYLENLAADKRAELQRSVLDIEAAEGSLREAASRRDKLLAQIRELEAAVETLEEADDG